VLVSVDCQFLRLLKRLHFSPITNHLYHHGSQVASPLLHLDGRAEVRDLDIDAASVNIALSRLSGRPAGQPCSESGAV